MAKFLKFLTFLTILTKWQPWFHANLRIQKGFSACFTKVKIHSKILSSAWQHIYHLIAYKIIYLTIYFVFKRGLSICHIIQRHFTRCPLLWGSISKTVFSGKFRVLPFDYSLYEKTILGIFVYLFICEVTTTKVDFRFYK